MHVGAEDGSELPLPNGITVQSIYLFYQSTTGRCQPDIVGRIGIASTAMHSMKKSLATDPASTADKTSLVPDLYTIHFVVRFGDMDTSAGRSTEAPGLPHAFPAYDPRGTLA